MQVYRCEAVCDLWQSPAANERVSQLWPGRTFQIVQQQGTASAVQSLEDGYQGWLGESEYQETTLHPRPGLVRAAIQARLEAVLAFAETAAQQPNTYLWGGSAGPNYDCSGLVQRSFASIDIWLPRDAYQQAAWCEPLAADELERGDLIFFQHGQRVDHVAIYGGAGRYLHSSGARHGHNGIAWDQREDTQSPIARHYNAAICGYGRIMRSLDYPCVT
ncbi:MAG: C40 family peptidase [Synechococcaceae cyanobacterium SM2_3_60]|nr:C40 family peptidase [Synechococcaceae cyanobacterium SM2_3_60]